MDSLLKATNCERVEWAAALLDVAIATGALSVLVFSSDYWMKNQETGFRAVPVVDAEILLGALTPSEVAQAPVCKDEGVLLFDTRHSVDVEGHLWKLQIQISPDAQRNRLLLMGLMTAAGWDFYRNEWWHYQLFNARANYPVFSDTALAVGMMG